VIGSAFTVDANRLLYIPLSAFGGVDLFIVLTVTNKAGQTAYVQAFLSNINDEWILMMPRYKLFYDGKGYVNTVFGQIANTVRMVQSYWAEKVIRSNTDILTATWSTNVLAADFVYSSFILPLQSSYTLTQDLTYTIGVDSATLSMLMTVAVDTNYANLNCLICKYIGLLNTRILLSDYAIEECGDEMELIKRLFRYMFLMEYSCDMSSNTLKEIKCFLDKECKQIELECINCN
jgi:hypothetical protein